MDARSVPVARLVGVGLGLGAIAGTAAAHAGALRLSEEPPPVPLWLVLLTGGAVIGASFLFASLLTDPEEIDDLIGWRVSLPRLERLAGVATPAARAIGIVGLVAVVATGIVGPHEATRNFALVFVWAGWWAGYTMSVYLLGNTWPALNPWRTIAGWLPRLGQVAYPRELGAWPAVVGLLGLVWIEVVTPVAAEPPLLAVVVLVYTAVTLAGAAAFGVSTWFDSVDPIARVFRWYGAVAPLQRTDDGVEFTVPGSALRRRVTSRSEIAFVIALLWATTFDGFVSTAAWGDLARVMVGVGLPPTLAYLGVLIGGFVGFLGVFRGAAAMARRTGPTYVSTRAIGVRFAPALLPIAAGYHLAHFLGYFLSLLPALGAVIAAPVGPPSAVAPLAIPGWFGVLELLFVLGGHVLAIWIAHAVAFDLFTGRLQPIRSQYPFIAVMILYTMTSMWIITQPYAPPPFV